MARPSAEGSGGRPRGAGEVSVLLARYGTRKVSLGHARPPAHVKLACPFHQLVARRAEHVDAAERLCCAAPRAAAALGRLRVGRPALLLRLPVVVDFLE